MNHNDTAEVEGIDTRDVRALTEYMTVLDDVGAARGAPGLYVVVSQSGSEYIVDADGGACECRDAEYRNPTGGCKHVRRALFATGRREIPEWADRDAVDDQLGMHVDDVDQEDTAADTGADDRGDLEREPRVAADGGQIAWQDVDDETGDGYTEHVEPAAQGAARYVRCEGCGRELLEALGGRDQLPHVDGCPNAGVGD